MVMKILFSILILLALNTLPQDRWIKLNGPEGGVLQGIITKGDTVVTGTAYSKGVAFYSFDRGEHWERAGYKIGNRFADFCFTDDGGIIVAASTWGGYKSFNLINWFKLNVSGDFWSVGKDYTGRLYAGADNGELYGSSDHGLTWIREMWVSGRIENFYLSPYNKLFAGGYSKILVKDLGTSTWTMIYLDSVQNSVKVFSDTSDILYATSLSKVLISTDSGTTWKKQPPSSFFNGEYMNDCLYNNRLIGAFGDETQWFGIGWGAAVSDDQGITWQWSQSGLPPKITGSRLAKSGSDTYISTRGSGVFKSTDYGGSWFAVNNGLTAAHTLGIHIDNEGTLYSASWGNGISKSTDKGESWKMINSGVTNVDFYSIVSDDNGNLFAGSERGTYRSTDKGESWMIVTDLYSYHLIKDNLNRIYSLSYGAGLYRTTNQGATWVRIDKTFNSGFIFGFAMDSTGNIYAGGRGGGAIYKSTDDGNSWIKVYQGISSAVVTAISVSPNGNIFAAIINEGVLRSTDQGLSWLKMNNGLPGTHILPLIVNSVGEIYAAFQRQGIYLSTNDGNTWQDITDNMEWTEVNEFVFHDSAIYLATDESVWRSSAVVPVELASFSSDIEGNTLHLKWITSSETNNHGFKIERKTEGEWTARGFIEGNGTTTEPKEYSFQEELSESGKYSYRLKQIDYDGSYEYSNIVNVDFSLTPKEYSLKQNYPNPFNPTTIINYSVPRQGNISIILYDALGREVTRLVDEEKSAGEYSVEFNASNLSSGLYICHMKGVGFNQSRKILYLK